MPIPLIVLSIILAVVMLAAATPKLIGQKEMSERMTKLGVSPGLTKTIGALEVAGAVGLLVGLYWWPAGALAAVGLALLLVGATVYHLRAKDSMQLTIVPALFAVAAAVVAVLHLV